MDNISPIRCRAVRADGLPCEKVAMKGGRYCYRHSLFRLKGGAVLKNLTVHILVIVAGLLFSSWYVVPYWKEDWLSIMDHVNQGITHVEALRALLNEERSVLSGKYGPAYVLFAIDSKGNKVFDDLPANSPVGIDWDPLRAVQMTPETVGLVSPAIFYKGQDCAMNSTIITVSRSHPAPAFLCRLGKKRMHLHVLRDEGSAVVFALVLSGF